MISSKMAGLLNDAFDNNLTLNTFSANDNFNFSQTYNGFNAFLKFEINNPFVIPIFFEHIYQYFVLGNYIVFPINVYNFLPMIAKRSSDVLVKAFSERAENSNKFHSITFKEKKYYIAPGIVLDEYYNIIIAACKQGIYDGTEPFSPITSTNNGRRLKFNDTIPTFLIYDKIYFSSDPVEKYVLKEIVPYIAGHYFFIRESEYGPFKVCRNRVTPEIMICNTIKYTMKPTQPTPITNDKNICESVLNDIKEIYEVDGLEKINYF